jgi:hypothetical protein
MTDIVERLRALQFQIPYDLQAIGNEAAAELEQLRLDLAEFREQRDEDNKQRHRMAEEIERLRAEIEWLRGENI